jgi:hypothetical protein
VTGPVPVSASAAAALLLQALAEACPDGEVRLIGSRADEGRPDDYSDVDLRWSIPPGSARQQLRSLRATLQQVAEVESLRADPEQRSDLRLVFVRFRGWPLWWRVDLEIHSPGVHLLAVPGLDPWSPAESACMGVVVTVKALARRRPEVAEVLFARARARVGAADPAGDWPARIEGLLDQLVASSPQVTDLVSRTRALSREVLGP